VQKQSRNKKIISITLNKEVIEILDEIRKKENRTRSNAIETLILNQKELLEVSK